MLIGEAFDGEVGEQVVDALDLSAVEQLEGGVGDAGVDQKHSHHEGSHRVALVGATVAGRIDLGEDEVDDVGTEAYTDREKADAQ